MIVYSRLPKLTNMENPVSVMQLSESTYQRLKRNSDRYGDRENYEQIIIRLLDFYENNNK